MAFDLIEHLRTMVQESVSDLHLKVGTPPVFRKNRDLVPSSKEIRALTPTDLQNSIYPLLTPYQHDILMEAKQVDFSYGVKALGRFRFSVFFQRGTLRAVIRHIPYEVPSLTSLNLPSQLKKIIDNNINGLILVTGATGNGKTSTIVSMIDYINQNKRDHIITIEDPIEFLIKDKKSLITQRELGSDYMDYNQALKATLRQDPNTIFFGELRDAVTMETTLNAANTGHLVFSTLHTNNVAETVTRVLGMVNEERSRYVRMEFASCLKAIICQRLCMRKDGKGFYPAVEILVNNPRVREILEDGDKSPVLLQDVIEQSKEVWGMQSFNQNLKELYQRGIISKEEALKNSESPEKLRLFFQGLSHDNSSSQTRRPSSEPVSQVTSSSRLQLEDTRVNRPSRRGFFKKSAS